MSYPTITRNIDIDHDREVSAVRERLGRGDLSASILGMLTAIGVLALIGAAAAAASNTIDYQLNLIDGQGALDEFSSIGVLVALGAVFVSFLVGGLASGRMARYDGGLNGMGTALWMLLLITVFAALEAFVAAEFNILTDSGLPNWIAQIDSENATLAAVVVGIASIVLMFVAGYIGGRLGEMYHRRLDIAMIDVATAERVVVREV
jgi:hypothetical protein